MKYEMMEAAEGAESLEITEQGIELEHFGRAEQFEPNEWNESKEGTDAIYGNPEKDAESWHRQEQDMSCAVACQEFVAEQLTGREFEESELSRMAEENGWFTPEGGTPMNDVGKILESMGISVERGQNYTLSDMAEALENGEKVICGVNNSILSNPVFARIPGMRANHAVEVIGIDASDSAHVKVILNDPGVENGKGLRVDADTFAKAWGTSDNFAVFAKN